MKKIINNIVYVTKDYKGLRNQCKSQLEPLVLIIDETYYEQL